MTTRSAEAGMALVKREAMLPTEVESDRRYYQWLARSTCPWYKRWFLAFMHWYTGGLVRHPRDRYVDRSDRYWM